jgi:hypothetical protein
VNDKVQTVVRLHPALPKTKRRTNVDGKKDYEQIAADTAIVSVADIYNGIVNSSIVLLQGINREKDVSLDEIEGSMLIAMLEWASKNPEKVEKLVTTAKMDNLFGAIQDEVGNAVDQIITNLNDINYIKKHVDRGVIEREFPYAASEN